MSNRRVIQHRQQREANTRDKRELEQENRKLKREVARLRKEVEKAETPLETEEIEESKATLKCSSCKGINLASITTPSGKTRHICRDCGWRGPIQTSAIRVV